MLNSRWQLLISCSRLQAEVAAPTSTFWPDRQQWQVRRSHRQVRFPSCLSFSLQRWNPICECLLKSSLRYLYGIGFRKNILGNVPTLREVNDLLDDSGLLFIRHLRKHRERHDAV